LALLCQALAEEQADTSVDLWVVTNQLQQVESGDLTHPEKATLVALGKVVPQEYERVTCRIIDVTLPPADSRREELLTSQILAEVNSDSPDPIIAYRGRRRWIQAFEPSRLESDKAPISRLRQNGVYLITGGLGGIGLLLAEYLAQRMQLKLALTGRSMFPARERWRQWLDTHIEEDEISRKIRKLLAIEEMGSEILVLSADAADLKQMQAAVANVHERFGEIHGVIHAAGMAGEKTVKLLSELERSHCEAQFRGKIHGLYVLEKVLQDDEVDFFILFSSNASILGGLGSLGYAAANLFMDSFAANRNYVNGRRWISVNWDGWLLNEDGRLSSSFQTSLDRYAMRPSESTEAFMRILSRANAPQIAVSTWDLPSRIEQWVTDQSRVKDINSKEKATTELHPRPDLGIAYVPPSNQLEEKIARIWQDLLGIEQLGIHDNFFDLGGNSLIALKVISHLKKELRIEIPIVSLFEGPTVKALAQVISQPGQKRPAYKESQDRGEFRRQSKRTRRKERTIETRRS
jgi:NAD(P)-dependent dehydrogenase (short-subunit alcohol dehydrogenase family)/acyl carrier protein